MANAVETAIQHVGGPTKASHICDVSVACVYKWRRAGWVMDTRAAVALSRASGMSVEALAGLDPAYAA